MKHIAEQFEFDMRNTETDDELISRAREKLKELNTLVWQLDFMANRRNVAHACRLGQNINCTLQELENRAAGNKPVRIAP